MVAVLLPQTSWGATFSTSMRCYACFPLLFLSPMHFQGYLGQPLRSLPLSEVVSHVGDTVRLFCHILCCILGSLDLLNYFCWFAHTKGQSLCTETSCGLRRMQNVLYSPLHVHANSFTNCKKLLCCLCLTLTHSSNWAFSIAVVLPLPKGQIFRII